MKFQMNKALLLKFTQHERLRMMLLNTADASLVEVSRNTSNYTGNRLTHSRKDSPTDWFWGIGADRKGQNQLGLALMHVRQTLRDFES
jgi:predicted NAD-dependent protein-ADP-ribosyltransferase YbiA (DUF1768 family)